MKHQVALVIVFNHKYDENIEKLDKIYEGRFSHIYYLVPFYNGTKQNVIPIYECSYYFQGYIAQGFTHYFQENYQHYFFMADDMMLNPCINENNYRYYFNLTASTSFIPEVHSLDNINDNHLYCSPGTIKDGIAKLRGMGVKKWWWCRVVNAFEFRPKNNGIESFDELPTYCEAESLLKRHGIIAPQLTYLDIYGGPKVPLNLSTLLPNIKYLFCHGILNLKYKLPYPLTCAYSDIVIVSHLSIKKFVHYCGLFAAASLFVEVALPTALLFASDEVMTEPKLGRKGKVFWPQTKKRKVLYEREIEKFDYKVEKLLHGFPEDTLYLHPVKLSNWE